MTRRHRSAIARRHVKKVTLGLRQIVKVPSAWSAFTYAGRVYDRRENGQWILRGGWKTGESGRLTENKRAQDFIDFDRGTQISLEVASEV